MQYDPKLKKAMEEIKAVVEKYGIGAMVCLHSPGFSEYINKIQTPYSALKLKNDGSGYTVLGHSKHYGGDKGKRDQVMADTRNMIEHFERRSGGWFMIFNEIAKGMDDAYGKWDSEPGSHSSNIEQNN